MRACRSWRRWQRRCKSVPFQVCANRPHCSNLVQCGYCDACRERGEGRDRRPSAAARGYDGKWAAYSKARLRRYPTCEGLRLEPDGPVLVNTHPGRLAEAKVTDHILPHKGDDTLKWAPWNHQSGCKTCHDVKTARHDGGFGRAGSLSRLSKGTA
jgi:5-methylcytosine-specific restriction protein A